MKDEIIVVIRTLENIMEDKEMMKIINTVYQNPLGHAKDALLSALGKILAEEVLK